MLKNNQLNQNGELRKGSFFQNRLYLAPCLWKDQPHWGSLGLGGWNVIFDSRICGWLLLHEGTNQTAGFFQCVLMFYRFAVVRALMTARWAKRFHLGAYWDASKPWNTPWGRCCGSGCSCNPIHHAFLVRFSDLEEDGGVFAHAGPPANPPCGSVSYLWLWSGYFRMRRRG